MSVCSCLSLAAPASARPPPMMWCLPQTHCSRTPPLQHAAAGSRRITVAAAAAGHGDEVRSCLLLGFCAANRSVASCKLCSSHEHWAAGSALRRAASWLHDSLLCDVPTVVPLMPPSHPHSAPPLPTHSPPSPPAAIGAPNRVAAAYALQRGRHGRHSGKPQQRAAAGSAAAGSRGRGGCAAAVNPCAVVGRAIVFRIRFGARPGAVEGRSLLDARPPRVREALSWDGSGVEAQ